MSLVPLASRWEFPGLGESDDRLKPPGKTQDGGPDSELGLHRPLAPQSPAPARSGGDQPRKKCHRPAGKRRRSLIRFRLWSSRWLWG
jgi:hypothetical protein